MTTWLDKLAKVLALALDTRVEPEQRAAMAVATRLAARHKVSLGRAYLRIERSMPSTYNYLETKREAAGVAGFVVEGDAEVAGATWDADLANYPGNRRAYEAMLACTIRPLRARPRPR